MREILRTQRLSHTYYGQQPLLFPDVIVNEGDSLLITGNSGTGKTTMLHLLGGLLRPQEGLVVIKGEDLKSMPASRLDRFRAENIGIVLQEAHFVKAISVFENICLASWLATGNRNEVHARELLEFLGLGGHGEKLPSKLSIGQQQRASIARALVNRPAILLADEPTSSLDDANAMKVADLLREASSRTGASLIIVTHDARLRQQFDKQVML